jgi:copper(I)-binding protein
LAADEPSASPPQTVISKTGDLTIEQAWSRATPGGATVGAGYLRITNAGSTPDVLTAVTSPVAEHVEIHEMTSTDGIMRMRELAGGLELKPGETAELKPGGLHLMLVGLKSPLKEGERFWATLKFKHAAEVEVEFAVVPLGAGTPGHSHH